jgi:ABC-2 type transport system permease protein
LLGLLFWGSFLAAVAATIDDPHSSSRSSLMLVPTIPASLMFLTLDAVDHPAMWVASHLPLTSMAAMPVRALLGEVHGLEVLLSALVLAACTALMRRYASRVFRAHMLLYGKEPTWRELWRCLRSDEAGRG